MLVTAVISGLLQLACLAAPVTPADRARRALVSEMLDLDPKTCSDRKIQPVFDQTSMLLSDCQSNINMLAMGLQGVDQSSWKRNVARNAWWAYGVEDLSKNYKDNSVFQFDDRQTAKKAYAILAIAWFWLNKVDKPDHPSNAWPKSPTRCHEDAFSRSTNAANADPNHPYVLTALGISGGKVPAYWVLRNPGENTPPTAYEATGNVDNNVCEGKPYRVQHYPKNERPNELVLCDDWFGLPDLVEEEVTLEGQAPFMAGKDPPEVDELETTSYAAEHLLYIIYHLMQTSRVQDRAFYFKDDVTRRPRPSTSLESIAILALRPNVVELFAGSHPAHANTRPDTTLMPSAMRYFCKAGFFKTRKFEIPDRGAFIGYLLSSGHTDTPPEMESDEGSDEELTDDDDEEMTDGGDEETHDDDDEETHDGNGQETEEEHDSFPDLIAGLTGLDGLGLRPDRDGPDPTLGNTNPNAPPINPDAALIDPDPLAHDYAEGLLIRPSWMEDLIVWANDNPTNDDDSSVASVDEVASSDDDSSVALIDDVAINNWLNEGVEEVDQPPPDEESDLLAFFNENGIE